MKVNSFKAMAAFVRAFFDAFTRGVIDASSEGCSPQEQASPRFIKKSMVNHYDEVYQSFMQTAFLTLCRLNYKDYAEVEAAMPKNMRTNGGNFEELLHVACKTGELHDAMVYEYKRNFSALLSGHIPTPAEHLSSYVHGNQEALIEEPMAVHLLTRLVIQAYVAGLKAASQGGQAMQTPMMPSLHSLLLGNAICLLQDSSISPRQDEDLAEFFQRACKTQENLNVLFNTLNDTLKEMVKES